MRGQRAEERYDSLVQFYGEVCPQALTEARAPGHLGAAMIPARQEPADWSDTPMPDLVVSSPVRCHEPATVGVGGRCLEFEELALAIGKRILHAHSDLDPPARRRTIPLSAREEALLHALLIEAVEAGFADVASELDRSQHEAARALGQALRTAPPEVRVSFARRRSSWRALLAEDRESRPKRSKAAPRDSRQASMHRLRETAMQIIALLSPTPQASLDVLRAHAVPENRAIWDLYRVGTGRAMHFRPDRPGAFLTLKAGSPEEARQAVSALPMVAKRLLAAEMIPVGPFVPLENFFASAETAHASAA